MQIFPRTLRFFFVYFIFAIGAFAFSRSVLAPLFFIGVSVKTRRRINAKAVRFYLWLLSAFDIVQIKAHAIPPQIPCVLVYNHPTLFDALIAITHSPESCCVVKRGLIRSLAYGVGVRALQFISSQDAEEFMKLGKQELEAGRSIIIFPEGTRGSLQKFHRSAARLALEANVPIIGGVITCDPPILGKNSHWYNAPKTVANVSVDYLEPLYPPHDEQPPSLQSRTITEHLETQFRMRLMPNERIV